MRRASRQLAAGGDSLISGENGVGIDRPLDPTGNPWRDAASPSRRPSRTAPVRLNHRLSFDGASGVIMLPDDGDWLIEDVDSDEDYGIESDLGNLLENDGGPGEASSQPSNPALLSPSKRRYGTYYHHPERRRQTVPGAFPRS